MICKYNRNPESVPSSCSLTGSSPLLDDNIVYLWHISFGIISLTFNKLTLSPRYKTPLLILTQACRYMLHANNVIDVIFHITDASLLWLLDQCSKRSALVIKPQSNWDGLAMLYDSRPLSFEFASSLCTDEEPLCQKPPVTNCRRHSWKRRLAPKSYRQHTRAPDAGNWSNDPHDWMRPRRTNG